jgi:hypothetical protein
MRGQQKAKSKKQKNKNYISRNEFSCQKHIFGKKKKINPTIYII